MSSYNFSHHHHHHHEQRGHGRRARGGHSRHLAAGEQDAESEQSQSQLASQRWLSINTLGGGGDHEESRRKNFARLRKGYASMRKSFRAQVLGKNAEARQPTPVYWFTGELGARGAEDRDGATATLINQIGSSAARLLRRGVTQVRRSKLRADAVGADDAIQSTDGSFKVLSPGPSALHESEATYENIPIVATAASAPTKLKSDAEREVDLRLRRSKRRVLPSAQYKPPNSELACQGLDLNELEQIKRDNLRLTLSRTQKAGRVVAAAPASGTSAQGAKQVVDSLEADRTGVSGQSSSESVGDDEHQAALEAIVCSCKHFEGLENDDNDDEFDQDTGRYEEIRDRQYYCSCASISSFSCQGEEVDATGGGDSDNDEPAPVEEEEQVEQEEEEQVEQEEQEEEEESGHSISGADSSADQFCEDTHEKFVNFLREGRRALSQPNLAYSHPGDQFDPSGKDEGGTEQPLAGVGARERAETAESDDEGDEKKTPTGGARNHRANERTIESSNARPEEVREAAAGVLPTEGRPTARDTHASPFVTLNVRELERLCGDLAKSCRPSARGVQSDEEEEEEEERSRAHGQGGRLLCDVPSKGCHDNDYRNEKCPANDDDGDGEGDDGRQQRHACCKKAESRLAEHLNEQTAERARRERQPHGAEQEERREQQEREGKEQEQQLSAAVVEHKHRESDSRRVGGVSSSSNKARQHQQVAAGAWPAAARKTVAQPSSTATSVPATSDGGGGGAAEQRGPCHTNQSPTDRSISCTPVANDRDLRQSGSHSVGPVDTCGSASVVVADHLSGRLIGPAAQGNQDKHALGCEHANSSQQEEGAGRGGRREEDKRAPIDDDSTKRQVRSESPTCARSIYGSLPGDRERELERRKRQQQRREEIMLSLSGQPELWHELVAEGRPNERAVDARQGPVCRQYFSATERAPQGSLLGAAAYGTLSPSDEKHLRENIYSSLYEDPVQGPRYCSIDASESHARDLHDKERRLFEGQISHLRLTSELRADDCAYEILHHLGQPGPGSEQVASKQRKQTKRSLLGRLKSLIAPAGKGERDTFAGAPAHAAWPACAADRVSSASQAAQREVRCESSRWDDFSSSSTSAAQARGLSSMSTQNLFNSSMRYLSASRKSVNLAAGLGGKGATGANETDGFFSSKSFISGFLTLGRRSGAAAVAVQTRGAKGTTAGKKQNYESLGQLFKNHQRPSQQQQQQQQPGALRRGYGSFDSLPSADSGLSCGHLQNSSSSDENHYSSPPSRSVTRGGNIYSCTSPAIDHRTEQRFLYENENDDDHDDDDKENHRRHDHDVQRRSERNPTCLAGETQPHPSALIAVGKARARVDCNPCAYDKEALVFKRGDLIDILERHQSGTWIGRRGSQVGHFKFINVVEIREEQKTGADGGPEKLGVSAPVPQKSSGSYVTKLEIKNESHLSYSSRPDKPRRSSFSSAPSDECAQRQQQQVVTGGQLANSSESLMGSLEQLLASIGLDSCRQGIGEICGDRSSTSGRRPGSPTAAIDHQNDGKKIVRPPPRAELSYLEMLNRGGVKSLDSFSSIEQSADLERMGIMDEEHRRRLLMAAKIIRQALRAAKLDLAEAGRSVGKSETTVGALPGDGVETQPAPLPPPPPLLPSARPTDCVADKRTGQLPARSADEAAGRPLDGQGPTRASAIRTMRADGREPVYVNLLLSTNKISRQSASSCEIESARTTCNKSIASRQQAPAERGQEHQEKEQPRQPHQHSHLTTFGTNFLFNDLSQETGLAAYQDHNECESSRAHHQPLAGAQQSRAITNTNTTTITTTTAARASQRDESPHLADEGRTAASGLAAESGRAAPWRGVNNFDSINQSDCHQFEHEPASHPLVRLDTNNSNSSSNRVPEEPLAGFESELPDGHGRASADPGAAFKRGCSVRVSSRKPKSTSSRVTPRESYTKRGSQDYSRVHPPSTRHFRQHPAPGHCSIRSLRHRGSSSELSTRAASRQAGQGVYLGPGRAGAWHQPPQAPPREINDQQCQLLEIGPRYNKSHHLLEAQAQIMNSKSAYDLRLNFSKFLES